MLWEQLYHIFRHKYIFYLLIPTACIFVSVWNGNRKQNGEKERGAESQKRLTAPRVCVGAAMVLLRSRTLFLREKVICIGCAVFLPGKPHKSRLFSPLLRNKGAAFPHALRCLPVRDTLPAVRAVFDIIRP